MPEVSTKAAKFSGRLVVEISDPRNRNHLLFMSRELIRGRWERANLISDENVEDLESVPDVPGMAIEIDTEKRTVRIFDPLETEEHAETMERLKRTRFGKDTGPAKEGKNVGVNDDDLKSWIYWLWRLTQIPVSKTPSGRKMSGPAAKAIDGTEMPTLDAINQMPGKIRRGLYNASAGFKNESQTVNA